MASSALPAPGTKYGPCAKPCDHRDCAITRADAARLCAECGKPIGYDRHYYADTVSSVDGIRECWPGHFDPKTCWFDS